MTGVQVRLVFRCDWCSGVTGVQVTLVFRCDWCSGDAGVQTQLSTTLPSTV